MALVVEPADRYVSKSNYPNAFDPDRERNLFRLATGGCGYAQPINRPLAKDEGGKGTHSSRNTWSHTKLLKQRKCTESMNGMGKEMQTESGARW